MTDPPVHSPARCLGVIKFSAKLFDECVERGFPFPPGTSVLGVRQDVWDNEFEILVLHNSLAESPEGFMIPVYSLLVDSKTRESAFVPLEIKAAKSARQGELA